MELIDVVDAKNHVVGKATIGEAYERKAPHRIAHVLVFNSKGELLLQFRSKHKKFTPHCWSTSVGGHVSAGETYEAAAKREMQEEIGVQAEITPLFDDVYEFNGLKKFLRTFKAIHNGPFRANPAEVEQLRFFPMLEVGRLVAEGEKMHPELVFLLERHFGMRK